MIRLVIVAFGVILCPLASRGGDLIFETKITRLTLSADGTVRGFLDKSSNEEWLQSSAASRAVSFAAVRAGGQTIAASEIRQMGDRLTVRFGESAIEAEYRVTTRPDFILFDLTDVRGGEVDEIAFAQLPIKTTERGSSLLNLKWNNQVAICLMALDDRTEATFGPRASLSCTAHRELGLSGHKAALIAVPTSRFYDVVQEIEREFAIPHATLGGQWAKTSTDVRRSYLFIDLTEDNADEVIRLAKLGGFGAILTYSGTWATSNGSYPINRKNFPRGEDSLKAVADKCHAAGLKLGIHMLTSFVGKDDPLVRPKPDARLLSDTESVLAGDIDPAATEIVASKTLKNFPGEASYYGEAGGMDVQIDGEILRYEAVGGDGSRHLLRCARGINGTAAATHKAGAKIRHLAQRYNSYLVDLRTSLKDEVAERIAGVINRCGLDMIYFDGGEVNSANGASWYWVGVQQTAVFSRVKRDLLVQGSGTTHWTWHFFSRGTCDDFAALAPKEFLDYHKIADNWQSYRSSFMPAELGWWGFLSAKPDRPPTAPDEVEFYATRMIALESAVSIETTLADLKKCGQAEDLLRQLGEYEQVRLSGRVGQALRDRLKTGEWHWSRDERGDWQTQPVRYDAQRTNVPAKIDLVNTFQAQPLRFRMQIEPALAPTGDKANIPLLADRAIDVQMPSATSPMPGALAHRISFATAAGDQPSALMVGSEKQYAGKAAGKVLDLTHHRALAVQLEVHGDVGGSLPAVLNVQLESEGKRYRDYYIDLNFTGERTVTLPSSTARRMLPEFRPSPANYPFKMAGYTFNYARITALNLRWMRCNDGRSIQCRVVRVEALAESDAIVRNLKLSLGGREISIPVTLRSGDYAEFWGTDSIRIFDVNGLQKQLVPVSNPVPLLPHGKALLRIDSSDSAPLTLTTITLGTPMAVQVK